MKQLDVDSIVKAVKVSGFTRVENFLDEEDIRKIKEVIVPAMFSKYSEQCVKDRLFYLREDSGNRQGDAVMVCRSKERGANLPSIQLHGDFGEYLDVYNTLIGALMGVDVPDGSRSMMNCQQYYDHSLPVVDHYDGEFLSFEHGVKDKYGEKPLLVKEALLPRYVMVLVLENENDGKGTYVRDHGSEDRIELENRPGDLIIFDNISMRHGVPELEHPRMMIGFRNFDFNPYYFTSEEPSDMSEFYPLPDKINPGFIKPIKSIDAEALMMSFNEKWSNEFNSDTMKSDAAF